MSCCGPFPKAYGLASLRVGYAVCSSPEIARVIAAAKTPFDVNLAAQVAAVAARDDDAWLRSAVANIRSERQRLVARLRGIGLKPARSETNFVFLNAGEPSNVVAQKLLMAALS